MKIKFKRMADGKLPSRAYEYDVGFDCYANEDIVLPPAKGVQAQILNGDPENYTNPSKLVSLGFAMELPEGCYAELRDRSSMAVKGINISAGIIDNAYRGTVKACLTNLTGQPVEIKRGDKIVQMIIHHTIIPDIEEVDELGDSQRGEKGFGSSGK